VDTLSFIPRSHLLSFDWSCADSSNRYHRVSRWSYLDHTICICSGQGVQNIFYPQFTTWIHLFSVCISAIKWLRQSVYGIPETITGCQIGPMHPQVSWTAVCFQTYALVTCRITVWPIRRPQPNIGRSGWNSVQVIMHLFETLWPFRNPTYITLIWVLQTILSKEG
jgi:hypothetical protein